MPPADPDQTPTRTRRRKRQRVIITKGKTYPLSAEIRGLPIEDYCPGVQLPKSLHGVGAKIYLTADGPIVAVPRRLR